MRVLYPDNINEEIDELAQYMTFDKKTRKMVPRENARPIYSKGLMISGNSVTK